MTIASARAQTVAEILWELKQANKLATLTAIATKAGFSPGTDGRTMINCLKTVRRDWPQLQWWRAVSDHGVVDAEQGTHLVEAGFSVESLEGESVVLKQEPDQWMTWVDPSTKEESATE